MSERVRKAAKVLTPREAKTWRQVYALPRNHAATANYWLMVGGSGNASQMTLVKQRTGQKAEFMVHIPRREFERLVDWYNTGKWGRKR